MLSHIDEIKGFKHVYKLVNYFTHNQLILSWNLIWTCMHHKRMVEGLEIGLYLTRPLTQMPFGLKVWML